MSVVMFKPAGPHAPIRTRIISWVEETVGADIRVIGELAAKPRHGRPALAYRVERDDAADHGSFECIDEALACAHALAQCRG